ncbi:hypothetical protein CNEO3_270019 [Clostridium neonatale]|nr:hypothetical protein CNEO3_270019 [Clostridium neonatale]
MFYFPIINLYISQKLFTYIVFYDKLCNGIDYVRFLGRDL